MGTAAGGDHVVIVQELALDQAAHDGVTVLIVYHMSGFHRWKNQKKFP